MTHGQVLDPITAPHNISLFLLPALFAACCPHPQPITTGLCRLEHEAEAWSDADYGCGM